MNINVVFFPLICLLIHTCSTELTLGQLPGHFFNQLLPKSVEIDHSIIKLHSIILIIRRPRSRPLIAARLTFPHQKQASYGLQARLLRRRSSYSSPWLRTVRPASTPRAPPPSNAKQHDATFILAINSAAA